MRALALMLAPLALASGTRVVSAHGVRVVAPADWRRIRPAPDGSVVDPRAVLVAGTAGVRWRATACQVAAYRIPPAGAVVVVLRWAKPSGAKPGRAPLRALRRVTRPSFECFAGRGAAAQVTLGGHTYQVNVLVGDRAGPRRVREALRVARSF